MNSGSIGLLSFLSGNFLQSSHIVYSGCMYNMCSVALKIKASPSLHPWQVIQGDEGHPVKRLFRDMMLLNLNDAKRGREGEEVFEVPVPS